MGVEPTLSAPQAEVLPLYDNRHVQTIMKENYGIKALLFGYAKIAGAENHTL